MPFEVSETSAACRHPQSGPPMESAQELAEPLSPRGAADSRQEPAHDKAPLRFSGLKLKHRAVSVNWGFFFVSVITIRALLLAFLLGPLIFGNSHVSSSRGVFIV